MKLFLIASLIALVALLSSAYKDTPQPERQISIANLLLPVPRCQECRRVRYKITAKGGCYIWEVNKPDVLDVQNIPNSNGSSNCNDSAIVTPKVIQPERSPIWITARDRYTGSILRCQGHLQLIDKLNIIRQQRKIDVDDVQALHVQAFDDDGSAFSSLEGLNFTWTILNPNELEQTSFRESNVETTRVRKQIEQEGKQSDVFLVRGRETGEARVEVQIQEPFYDKTVKKDDVILSVIKPFDFEPPRSIYILPHQQFKFGLNHMKKEQVTNLLHPIPVNIPSEQYKWTSKNDKIATTDNSGLITAKNIAEKVAIQVFDTKSKDNKNSKDVNVVAPKKIIIRLKDITSQYTPGQQSQLLNENQTKQFWSSDSDLYSPTKKQWNLIIDHIYFAQLQLYADSKHLIEPCNNIKLDFDLDTKYFKIIKPSQQNHKYIIKALRTNDSRQQNFHELFFASQFNKEYYFKNLGYDIKQTPKYQFQKLQTRIHVNIYQKVKINHFQPFVNLPLLDYSYSSSKIPSQVWYFKYRKGGSGQYKWSSTKNDIVSADTDGSVHGYRPGASTITARDSNNRHNYDTIDVQVSQISSLYWMESKLEVLQNQYDQLTLMARDYRQRKFTNCTSIYAEWIQSNQQNEETNDNDENVVIDMLSSSSNFQYNEMGEVEGMYKKVSYFVQKESHKGLIPLHYKLIQGETMKQQIDQSEDFKTEIMRNYGICARREFLGRNLGLRKIRAYLPKQMHMNNFQDSSSGGINSNNQVLRQLKAKAEKRNKYSVESAIAQVRVYELPYSDGPKHSEYLSQLHQLSFPKRDIIANKMKDGDYFIAYGSTLHWKIKGGPSQWNDIPSSFHTNFTQKNLLNQKQEYGDLSNSAIQGNGQGILPNVPKFLSALKCKDQSTWYNQQRRYEVNMQFGNSISSTLLRPANVSLSVIINCALPKYQVLGWVPSRNNKAVVSLPRKIEHSQDSLPTFRVYQGSKLTLRSLILDRDEHMFFNHSSIALKTTPSNQQYGSLTDIREHVQPPRLPLEIQDDVYFMKNVYINQKAGEFLITGQTQGYIIDYNSTPVPKVNAVQSARVSDTIRVIVVKHLKLYPQFQSLYFHESNHAELRILQGSGHFKVSTNDTDIASVRQADGDPYKLLVFPVSPGPIKVIVKDTGLLRDDESDDTQVKAEVIFSDIYALHLLGGGHIEVGKQTGAIVKPIDINGNPFNETQYNYMNIELVVDDSTGITNEGDNKQPLTFSLVDQSRLLYCIQSVLVGNHAVVARSQRHQGLKLPSDNQKIEKFIDMVLSHTQSKPIHVSVFQYVRLLPDHLLLIPGGQYTIRVEGGPPKGLWHPEFKIQDKNIASIDQQGVVTGKLIGTTSVHLKMGYSQSAHQEIELSPEDLKYNFKNLETGSLTRTVQIRVAIANGLQLPAITGRNLKQGSVVRPSVELKDHSATFNFQIGPLFYGWKIVPPTSLSPWQRSFQSDFRDQDLIGAHLQTLNIGTAEVTAYVNIQYPEPYQQYNNKELSTTVKVSVEKNAEVMHPEYAEKQDGLSKLYLLPPNTFHQIEVLNAHRCKFSLMLPSGYNKCHDKSCDDNPLVTLHENGRIQAHQRHGKATVVVDDQGGDETRVNLRISSIYAILVERSYTLNNMAIGGETDVVVTYQDMVGRSFARKFLGLEVELELSHPHVVSVKLDEYASTITLRGLQKGLCNVIVSLKENKQIRDVFLVRVSMALLPSGPIYLSQMQEVQMSVTESSKNGKWQCDDPKIAIVNKKGMLTGKSEGKTRVRYVDSGLNHDVSAQVVVGKIGQLVVQGPIPKIISNYIRDDNYKSTVKIPFKIDSIKESNFNKSNYEQFKCQVANEQQEQWVSVFADNMTCVLNLQRPDHSRKGASKSPPHSIEVKATLQLGSHSLTNTVHFQFNSMFALKLGSKSVDSEFNNQINLYKDERQVEIQLESARRNEITAHASNEDKLNARISRSRDNFDQIVLLVTAIGKEKFQGEEVQISNPSTGQKDKITFNYDPKKLMPPNERSFRELGKSRLDSITENTEKEEKKVEEGGSLLNTIILGALFLLVLFFVFQCAQNRQGSARNEPYYRRNNQSAYGVGSRSPYQSADKNRPSVYPFKAKHHKFE